MLLHTSGKRKRSRLNMVSDQQPRDEMAKSTTTHYVEELADEHDYWMSLTDAARITRTSEPMVRRWVATGRLPTRQEPVGINQRTRLIRASDLALIRPIVDPTAAITDDIHKLDLLSIPRQQSRIQQDHQHLLEQIQVLRLDGEKQLHHLKGALEEGMIAQEQQVQEWNERFSTHQVAWQQALHLQQEQQENTTKQMERAI